MRTRFVRRWSMVLALLMALMPMATFAAAPQDPFTFQILQPLPDQVLTGDKLPMAVAFQSSDDAPIVRFEAYLDGTLLIYGTIKRPIAVGSFPVEASLADTGVKPGPHTLYIKLYDSKGRVVQHEQIIAVRPLTLRQVEHNAPRVRIVEPKQGETITGKTRVRVDAVDDTGIQWVKIYVNGKMRAMMNQGPFVLPWDPIDDSSAPGCYRLTARAIDLFDNETESDAVVVLFMNDRTGRTPIDLGTATEQTVELPGVFPVALAMLPSGGPAPARESVTAPALALVPELPGLNTVPSQLDAARIETMVVPAGQLLAVLPTKALPYNTGDIRVQQLNAQNVTTTAPLANLPGMSAPMKLSAGQTILLPALTLATPAETPATSALRQEVIERPTATATPVSPAPKAAPRHEAKATRDSAAPAVKIAAAPMAPSVAPATMRAISVDGTALPNLSATSSPSTAVTVAPRQEMVERPSAATLCVSGKATPTHTTAAGIPVMIAKAPVVVAPTAAPASATDLGITVRASYRVKPNETLQQIARVHATTPEDLCKLNPGITPERPLTQGATLTVPKPDVQIYLDNTPLAMTGPAPYIVNGCTMAPMRTLVEAKGGLLVWLPKTREVHAWANNTFIGVTIGKTEARVNADTYLLPAAATIQDNRAMVPLRFLMAAMDLQLAYNAETGTYFLVSKSQ